MFKVGKKKGELTTNSLCFKIYQGIYGSIFSFSFFIFDEFITLVLQRLSATVAKFK